MAWGSNLAKFIELAELRYNDLCISSSTKAFFTKLWQSSKVPKTSKAVIFPPSVVSCFS